MDDAPGGVTADDMANRRMTAVTGIGPGYWMVDSPTTALSAQQTASSPYCSASVQRPIPALQRGLSLSLKASRMLSQPIEKEFSMKRVTSTYTTASAATEPPIHKALPPADEVSGSDSQSAPETTNDKRKQQHELWATKAPDDSCANTDLGGQSEMSHLRYPTAANVMPEIWALAHVCMFAAYWANLAVIALWQLGIYAQYYDLSLPDNCRVVKIYYATSSVTTLVVAPLTVYVVFSLLVELYEASVRKRALKLQITVVEFPTPVTDICLAWPPHKLLAACVVVTISLFVFGWYLAGVLFIIRFDECGSFYTQGKVMMFFSGGFITICSIVIPLVAEKVLYKPKQAPPSISSSPRVYNSNSPVMSQVDYGPPQSPRSSAVKAMKILKDSEHRAF